MDSNPLLVDSESFKKVMEFNLLKGPGFRENSSPSTNPPPIVSERRNYIISVGIDVYQNARKLYSCKEDCLRLTELLIDDYEFMTLPYYSAVEGCETDRPMQLFNDEATHEGMRAFFNQLSAHPRFDRNNESEPSHNLVIFLSGHGTLQKNNKQDLFHWVPSDYDGLKPSTKLYSINQLTEAIGILRYHHLVLIADSCYSGGILPFVSLDVSQETPVETKKYKDEPSCWGLFSSTARQPSYGTGDISFFTRHLMEQLRNSSMEELSLPRLLENLDDAMETTFQRPVHGRLESVATNTGKFYFTPSKQKKDRISLEMIQSYLAKSITESLNYVDQKLELLSLRKTNHSLVVISNRKDSGLKLLMRAVKNINLFPGASCPLYMVDEKDLDLQGPATILDKIRVYFQLSLRLESRDEPMLIRQLALILENTDLYMGLYINRNTPENCLLVKQMIELFKKLNDEQIENHLYFFILDETNTDYSTVCSIPAQAQAPINIKMLTGPITLTPADLKEWCKFQLKLMNPPPAKNTYAADIFETRIYQQIGSNGSPGAVIREICQLANCASLADTLLNSFDNLPLNYVS